MRLEWILCGPTYKVLVALLDGEKTESEIINMTGYNYVTVKNALAFLENNCIVESRKGKYATYYKLNEENRFVKAFRAFIVEAGIELPTLKPAKLIYKEIAIELINYLINNWNEYLANIKDESTIKVPAERLKKIICSKWKIDKCNKPKSLTVFTAWVINAMIDEFERRGYKAWREYEGYRSILYVRKK